MTTIEDLTYEGRCEDRANPEHVTDTQLKALRADFEFDRDRVGHPGCDVRLRAMWALKALNELECLRKERVR